MKASGKGSKPVKVSVESKDTVTAPLTKPSARYGGMAKIGVKARKPGRSVISGRLNGDDGLPGQVDDGEGKASVIQAQRELKALKEENVNLKQELENIRSIYHQLVSEGPTEQYSERRVNLLKSQVIQLERQVLMQAEGLSSRSGVLLEVENNLQRIADDLRELLAGETRGPSVPVQRSQLTTLIETAESARIRLYKNLESNNQERLEQPLIYMGHFVKHKPHPYDKKPVTIMDVCSGKLEHLNLRHIAKLESKLFLLNQQLNTLHQSLNTIWSPDNQSSQHLINWYLPSAVNERLSRLLSKSDELLVECGEDLLSLSILVPVAPWPLLTKSIVPEISTDNVIASLPNFPKSKQQQVKSVIEAVVKASNYSRRVSKMEAKSCVEELRFHQALYDLQLKYIESLHTAVREAYQLFESSIQETVCKPLKDVLRCFEKLKETASEEALRQFLSTFKTHREQLNSAVEGFAATSKQSDGAEAISAHGQKFLDAMMIVVQQTSAERDQLAEELEAVKKMREEQLKEGLDVLRSDGKRTSPGGEGGGERGENKGNRDFSEGRQVSDGVIGSMTSSGTGGSMNGDNR